MKSTAQIEHQILLTSPAEAAESVSLNGSDELAALGYRNYGIFADDPEALKLFDEIEEARNQHLVEPSQS